MCPAGCCPLSLKACDTANEETEDSGALDVDREPPEFGSIPCPAKYSLSCPIVGGTHTSFKRVHAEHGHVLVVAASHLIFRFLQPLQARMTIDIVFSLNWLRGFEKIASQRTFESFMPIMFIDKDIICIQAINNLKKQMTKMCEDG